jgi:DNA-binding MarR family transcriptional regulator
MEVRQGNGFSPFGSLLKQRNIVLRGADALSQKGFTQVPNALLRHKAISPGAKLVYTMLLSYAWQNDFCFPGQETLAKDMGVTSRSVRTYLKELETKKFLTIQQQGQGRVNIYHLDLKARSLNS